jgi:hypothetical protein
VIKCRNSKGAICNEHKQISIPETTRVMGRLLSDEDESKSAGGSILCKHSGTKTKKKRSGGIDRDSRHYLFNSHNNVRRGMLCISITTRTLWCTTSIVTIVPCACWIKGVLLGYCLIVGLLFDRWVIV